MGELSFDVSFPRERVTGTAERPMRRFEPLHNARCPYSFGTVNAGAPPSARSRTQALECCGSEAEEVAGLVGATPPKLLTAPSSGDGSMLVAAGQAGRCAGKKNSVSASASTSGWVRGAACPAPGIS